MEVKGHNVRAHDTRDGQAKRTRVRSVRGAQHFPGFMKIFRIPGCNPIFRYIPGNSGMVGTYALLRVYPTNVNHRMKFKSVRITARVSTILQHQTMVPAWGIVRLQKIGWKDPTLC